MFLQHLLQKMSNFFNPANPRFRRGVTLLSTVLCTGAAMHLLLADFGSQEHVFSPVHRYMIPKIDAFFQVTPADIQKARDEPSTPTSFAPRLVNINPAKK